VLATSEEDGECFVLVETTNGRTGCPACGVIATGHGRSVVQIRDLQPSPPSTRLGKLTPVEFELAFAARFATKQPDHT